MTENKREPATGSDTEMAAPVGDAPASPPAPAGDGLPPARDERGRFVKGVSGNPKGKQKGLRNRITNERLALEAALREYIGDRQNKKKVLQSIDRLFEIIETGDDKASVAALKVLLDKVMPTLKDAQEDGEEKAPQIRIVIDNQTEKAVPVGVVIDGESQEIE